MATETLSNGARPGRRTGLSGRAGRVPGAVLALGVYAAVRAGGVLAVAVVAWWTGRSPVRVLGESWDSVWYLRIAEHGYGRTQIYPGIGSVQSDSAFFPLYPVLIRCASLVLPGSLTVAALAVAWIAAGAAAVGVYRVGGTCWGPAPGCCSSRCGPRCRTPSC